MSKLGLLFGRGARGLPPAVPVDFAHLVLPPSPNTCLAAPAGGHPGAHVTVPLLPVDAATAWGVLRSLGERFPRTSLIEAWPDRRQAQWVERSALVNYPDIIAAEVVPLPGGAGLYLYSRSLLGWSDLGVNRRRVDRWLAALEAALRQG
ncbi:DUF1499 domain-containing protein [Paeniroseomonas aquatica]|uniref:DUF1499 domain-containing protein n=1 Tax=Paeniroseomonas aquatica TaxID=373043 RepID=A0ABT8A9T6_9PROT|nr:DUF1499 domain-containing protein [Paeniroseomonas aquatica]MDN3566572.1 DUF1499 domain-containing protein [Paeniroseomonas aquatica]